MAVFVLGIYESDGVMCSQIKKSHSLFLALHFPSTVLSVLVIGPAIQGPWKDKKYGL